MLRRFVPLFILLLPLAEIACFIVVGRRIGLFPTLSLVVLSAIAGIVLMRIQGFGVLNRLRQSGQAGRAPGKELLDAAMILIAGILLLIPGFLSDIVGLALFLPPVRSFLWNRLMRNVVVVDIGGMPPGNRPKTDPQRTIDLDDGEFRRDDRP
ncbi:FxsA family protein [Shinella kummerowiae]|uniref:Membrane protein FxsA n=1 Tax=Shinella kummerowiae TaxID=417745 RepID=A0A6N8SFL4_9HYPH|nr:FxsA family protein [Shinella kummerowiae]MCT7667250.1 membrane protein FxsA [Shinella kummerowiae]MXN47864.1 membrane protein FxsA [Shinella kummerowiae]